MGDQPPLAGRLLVWLDLRELATEHPLLFLEIVVFLEPRPEAGAGSEVASESQRGVSGNPSTTVANLGNAGLGNADVLGEPVARNLERLQKLLFEDLSRMDVWEFLLLGHGLSPFVVVDDFNVSRFPVFPLKTDAPLSVDANAVLPFPIAAKRLEVICGRNPKVV